MITYRITLQSGDSIVDKSVHGVVELLRDAEVDDTITITIGEMTEEAYNALPEATGP